MRRVLAVPLLLALAGCAPRQPLARAIQARGGPLTGIVREVEAQVARGVPGTWRWRSVFRVPDLYAWTIYTAAEPNHVLFDGATVRTYVGDRLVATEAAATAALPTHARFTAVMSLDALLLPGVRVVPLAPGELPAGAVSGLVALFADGSRYRLGFDAALRLVSLDGPVALPPVGTGLLEARFSDFRRVRGLLLSHATAYVFGGRPLATERTLAVCPDAGGLAPADFRAPGTLPACPPS
jgi:hypothetical protein